jgi:hypothetical protein
MRDPIYRAAGIVTQRHVRILTPPADLSARMTRAIAGGGRLPISPPPGHRPSPGDICPNRTKRDSGERSETGQVRSRRVNDPTVDRSLWALWSPEASARKLEHGHCAFGILVATDFVVSRTFDEVEHERSVEVIDTTQLRDRIVAEVNAQIAARKLVSAEGQETCRALALLLAAGVRRQAC